VSDVESDATRGSSDAPAASDAKRGSSFGLRGSSITCGDESCGTHFEYKVIWVIIFMQLKMLGLDEYTWIRMVGFFDHDYIHSKAPIFPRPPTRVSPPTPTPTPIPSSTAPHCPPIFSSLFPSFALIDINFPLCDV
jgi:hypothetical protein